MVSRCSFHQSVKQGLRTVLLLKLQPSSWAHSAEQIPALPGLEFKNKRQQDFPILLPTESASWALLRQRFSGFILLKVQKDSGYKTQQIFSWSKDAPCTEQEEFLSASLAWWEYVCLPPQSSFHYTSQSLPRTINLLFFYPCMDFVWRRIIFRQIMRGCLLKNHHLSKLLSTRLMEVRLEGEVQEDGGMIHRGPSVTWAPAAIQISSQGFWRSSVRHSREAEIENRFWGAEGSFENLWN